VSEEKTEKASPRKRKESRKQGQVARTQELGGWVSLMAIGMAMPALLRHELGSLQALLVHCLTFTAPPTSRQALALLKVGAEHAVIALVALGLGVMLLGVTATIAQGGFYLATKQVKPSLKKLDPLQGAKRIFGPRVLWEGAKMLLKSSLVALLAYTGVKALLPLIGGLVPIGFVLDQVASTALGLIRNIAIAGVMMALLDYAVQRRRIGKQTRMTKNEVKQEHKQSEGDPLLKSAIRSRQLAAARNRMMADIPTADVVLVNPTHVAVALRYDAAKGAPRVVARGAGAVAAAIRAKATESRVPLVQDIPLARALYSSTQVGQQIPAELFSAVASVLAFVISRRRMGTYGGEHRTPRPDTALPDVPAIGRRRRISSDPATDSR
jgi:flagellar biosynthetic protein FlhB